MGLLWVVLLAVSVVTAAATGRMAALTAAVATSAQSAVTLALGLVGVMSLWLGLVKVAEEAGLVGPRWRAPPGRSCAASSRRCPRATRRMGAIVMNVSANLLGLGNAATPFGLEAMRASWRR